MSSPQFPHLRAAVVVKRKTSPLAVAAPNTNIDSNVDKRCIASRDSGPYCGRLPTSFSPKGSIRVIARHRLLACVGMELGAGIAQWRQGRHMDESHARPCRETRPQERADWKRMKTVARVESASTGLQELPYELHHADVLVNELVLGQRSVIDSFFIRFC
jgi:hypothetical protein